jgi:hypothetical protein
MGPSGRGGNLGRQEHKCRGQQLRAQCWVQSAIPVTSPAWLRQPFRKASLGTCNSSTPLSSCAALQLVLPVTADQSDLPSTLAAHFVALTNAAVCSGDALATTRFPQAASAPTSDLSARSAPKRPPWAAAFSLNGGQVST